jgi:hypothetical protein
MDAHDDVALVGVELPEGFERDLRTLHVARCTSHAACRPVHVARVVWCTLLCVARRALHVTTVIHFTRLHGCMLDSCMLMLDA